MTAQNNNIEPANYFKTLKIIHLAQVFGTAAFMMVLIMVANTDILRTRPDIAAHATFVVATVALFIVGLATGNYLFMRLTAHLSADQPLTERLNTYSRARIIRLMCIELPILFSLAMALINTNPLFIILALAGIIYLLTLRPQKHILVKDLHLSHEEQLLMDLL